MDTSPFHADEVAAQARAGHVLGAIGAIRPVMPDQHRDFFAGLSYLFVGGTDAAGAPVATMLTGSPGFVHAPDPGHLRVEARPSPGDPAASHLQPDAEVGILGLDLATRRRNRANGRIVGHDAGGFTLAVDQSFGNCPQYIQRRTIAPMPREAGQTEILSGLDPEARGLIAAADTLFVASRARAGI
ncbi:pyridoxamine 5'-phosphate oxidase family protein, partial [Methylobacterium trifolii]